MEAAFRFTVVRRAGGFASAASLAFAFASPGLLSLRARFFAALFRCSSTLFCWARVDIGLTSVTNTDIPKAKKRERRRC